MKSYLEHGRSMVEMLGVLAIVGVLSIGGVMGYGYGMDKYRANEIVNDVMLRAVDIISRGEIAIDEDLSGWEMITARQYAIGLENETTGIQVEGLPARLCQMVFDGMINNAVIKIGDVEYDTPTDGDICDKTNTMVFYVDEVGSLSNNTQAGTEVVECTTNEKCAELGVCMGCIIPDGQENGYCEYACQEMEYLESDGEQYIDTGVLVDNPNFKFELKFLSTSQQKRRLLQAKNFTYTQDWLNMPISETELCSGTILRPSLNTIHEVVFENNNFILNGAVQSIPSSVTEFDSNPTSTLKICSFGDPAQYTHERFAGRIYSVKLSVGGKKRRDFIPVLDPNGTPAMLDTVEEKLYYNQGSGQFTYK